MIKARSQFNIYTNEYDLLILDEFNDDTVGVFKPFTIERVDRYSVMEPTINRGAKEFMQAIADCAFEQGIYPRQLADKKDELAATKYHLEDFRRLVFKDKK